MKVSDGEAIGEDFMCCPLCPGEDEDSFSQSFFSGSPAEHGLANKHATSETSHPGLHHMSWQLLQPLQWGKNYSASFPSPPR